MNIEKKISDRFLNNGREQGWLHSDGVVVALSGGGDSMALLTLFCKYYRGRIVAAHLEHGFRGRESIEDALWVQNYCHSQGITCYLRYADVPLKRLAGESLEAAGRRVRYEFFDEVLKRENLAHVATAHNAGDVAETSVFNFFRGTGIRGLSGVPAVRARIVRPIIDCTREELRSYLAVNDIPWREDRTNSENDYARNKIRNQLLPFVRSQLNRSTDRAILGLAAESAALADCVESGADNLLGWLSRPHPYALACWDRTTAATLCDRTLADVLRAQGRRLNLPVLDRKRLDSLVGLIRNSGRWRFQWAGSVEICGSSEGLAWVERADLMPLPERTIKLSCNLEERVCWGHWSISVRLTERPLPAEGRTSLWSCRLPAEKMPHLTIRSSEGRWSVWWEAPGWPTFASIYENSEKFWTPGSFDSIQPESNYVIIVRVVRRSVGFGQ